MTGIDMTHSPRPSEALFYIPVVSKLMTKLKETCLHS